MSYPTSWQRKTIWSALTALSVVAIGAVFAGLIWLIAHVVTFLQPILIPFAVAGVLAYLLDPVVSRMVRAGLSRQRAVVCVFVIVSLALAAICVWVGPALVRETTDLVSRVPAYTMRAKDLVTKFAHEIRQKYHVRILPWEAPIPEAKPETEAGDKTTPETTSPVTPPESETKPSIEDENSPVPKGEETDNATAVVESSTAEKISALPPTEFEKEYDLQRLLSGDLGGWLKTELPVLLRNAWRFLITSVGGFLGIFGFLLSFVIVPLYLFYFLIESATISKTWADYLPLRASHFKDEVVASLTEINGYLIAFFRGQLLVSIINGTVTGIGLVVAGLDFGLLIGLLLCVLGLIPYLGIILCWIPAVIIASVQEPGWFVHLFSTSPSWWVFPLVITGVFLIVQQFDSWFVTPKIVGSSVGLHPMTVIFSVFLWSLMLGGLLGAILAVPLTATAKVLLKRYIWERQFQGKKPARAAET